MFGLGLWMQQRNFSALTTEGSDDWLGNLWVVVSDSGRFKGENPGVCHVILLLGLCGNALRNYSTQKNMHLITLLHNFAPGVYGSR